MKGSLNAAQRSYAQYAFLWVSLVLLALAVQPSQAAGPHRQLLDDSPIHAASYSFWDTHMRLCDVDSEGNCHTSTYALSVARFGSGGAAAAVLTLLLFLIFLPTRSLCNGFGGKKPSYGICPSSSSDKREYTRGEILTVKILACLVVIPVIIGVGIGFKSNSDISTSVHTITNSLVQSGDSILQSLLEVKAILLTLPFTANSTDIINSAVDTATTIDNHMNNAHDTTNKYDNIREALMIVGFICALVLMVAGVACVIFNLRALALILGALGFLALTVIWISFGIHLVADKFAYDVCIDIGIITSNNTAVSNETSVFKTGALAKLWECDNNYEFAELQLLVNESMGIAASDACDARAHVCYNATSRSGDPNWQCADSPACGASTLTVVTDGAHMTILDNGVTRTLAQCAVNCTNAVYRNESYTLVTAVNLYANYTGLYYSTILPVITCQLAVEVLLALKDPICVTMLNALYGVAVSNLIMGIFFVAYIVLMIVGYKRFQSLDGGIV